MQPNHERERRRQSAAVAAATTRVVLPSCLLYAIRNSKKYIRPSVVSVLLFKVYLVNVGDYIFYLKNYYY